MPPSKCPTYYAECKLQDHGLGKTQRLRLRNHTDLKFADIQTNEAVIKNHACVNKLNNN